VTHPYRDAHDREPYREAAGQLLTDARRPGHALIPGGKESHPSLVPATSAHARASAAELSGSVGKRGVHLGVEGVTTWSNTSTDQRGGTSV
jgi:hypothetical protein